MRRRIVNEADLPEVGRPTTSLVGRQGRQHCNEASVIAFRLTISFEFIEHFKRNNKDMAVISLNIYFLQNKLLNDNPLSFMQSC